MQRGFFMLVSLMVTLLCSTAKADSVQQRLGEQFIPQGNWAGSGDFGVAAGSTLHYDVTTSVQGNAIYSLYSNDDAGLPIGHNYAMHWVFDESEDGSFDVVLDPWNFVVGHGQCSESNCSYTLGLTFHEEWTWNEDTVTRSGSRVEAGVVIRWSDTNTIAP